MWMKKANSFEIAKIHLNVAYKNAVYIKKRAFDSEKIHENVLFSL